MDEKCKEDNLSGPTPDAGNDAKTRCQIMNGFSVSVCDVKVCLNKIINHIFMNVLLLLSIRARQ